MNLIWRCLAFLAVLLGLVGFVACIAGLGGAWYVGSNLKQTSDDVFVQLDASVVALRGQVTRTRDRIRDSKGNALKMRERLRSWAGAEIRDRVRARLELDAIAERLVSALGQTRQWLEYSQLAGELVRQLVEAARPLGSKEDSELVNHLLVELDALRAQLVEVDDTIALLLERLSADEVAEGSDKVISAASGQVTKVVGLLDGIDASIARIDQGLEQSQADLAEVAARIRRWITIATIVAVFLQAWFAAAQLCLLLRGWNSLREKAAAATLKAV